MYSSSDLNSLLWNFNDNTVIGDVYKTTNNSSHSYFFCICCAVYGSVLALVDTIEGLKSLFVLFVTSKIFTPMFCNDAMRRLLMIRAIKRKANSISGNDNR